MVRIKCDKKGANKSSSVRRMRKDGIAQSNNDRKNSNKKGTRTYPGGQIIASHPNCRNNILELIAPPPQKIFGTVPVRLHE